MSNVPNLVNDDGTASIATALMMSHHGFRRDLARFARALDQIARGDGASANAVRDEWQNFRATLHGHHEAEDTGMFPNFASQRPSLRATIERLGADHRRIDPHLALEEAELIPLLRDAKDFPPPPTEEDLEMYAQGFAWAMDGIAPAVLEQVYAMLPAPLCAKLPAARAAFATRCERVWGASKAGSSKTPFPDGV
jgi:hypothetical protein